MKDTVSEQREHDEVDGGPHAGLHSSLRANPVVHHLIPVLSCEDLIKGKQQTTPSVTRSGDLQACLYFLILKTVFPAWLD